jgi:hypothetical protein
MNVLQKEKNLLQSQGQICCKERRICFRVKLKYDTCSLHLVHILNLFHNVSGLFMYEGYLSLNLSCIGPYEWVQKLLIRIKCCCVNMYLRGPLQHVTCGFKCILEASWLASRKIVVMHCYLGWHTLFEV